MKPNNSTKSAIEIVDRVAPTKVAKKPIVLTHCLQNDFALNANLDETSLSFFANAEVYPIPANTVRVERRATVPVFNIGSLDLIVVYRSYPCDAYPLVYLGHWNDGVIE